MTTMSARERMLGRLRAAVPANGAALASTGAELDQQIRNHYQPVPANTSELVAQMEAALRSSRAEVLCASAQDWPQLLAGKIAAFGARRLLLYVIRSVGAALAAALPDEVRGVPYMMPIEHWKSELFTTIDAGFTVAQAGIAATGTLVLVPDAGTPRTVSLVPPLHIALVYASTLYADMHAAMRGEDWSAGMPSNLVLASGPSKTSDIQQTLAYGAHGPRWMWVVIVLDGAAQGEQHV
ncbi:MAG: lactate utilization protein C [Sphingomonadaceae bacterium]